MSGKDKLIAHLTEERDKAREEAGVYKYRMEHYQSGNADPPSHQPERKAELDSIREGQARNAY
jgi:hypothetical protein